MESSWADGEGGLALYRLGRIFLGQFQVTSYRRWSAPSPGHPQDTIALGGPEAERAGAALMKTALASAGSRGRADRALIRYATRFGRPQAQQGRQLLGGAQARA